MDTWQMVALALIPVVVGPWIMRLKQRRKRPKIEIIVRCPHCESDIGLDRLRNYICGNCSMGVAFFTTPTGNKPVPDLGTYACTSCGTENFDGVVTCVECGCIGEKYQTEPE